MTENIIATGNRLINKPEVVLRAEQFAIASHGDQKYGDIPYYWHLNHAHSVAIRFGYINDPEIRASIWLHDVVEDCEDITLDTVEANFGKTIRDIVDAVTDRPGETKEEVFRSRLYKNQKAMIVKYCDRIANIEACLAESKYGILKRYVSEHDLFKEIPAHMPSELSVSSLSLYLSVITLNAANEVLDWEKYMGSVGGKNGN